MRRGRTAAAWILIATAGATFGIHGDDGRTPAPPAADDRMIFPAFINGASLGVIV